MPPETPLVSAIIISYNTRPMTLECLRALHADIGTMLAEVIVVDNASADGSVEAIRETFPQVKVIANSTNVGFGSANNQAMQIARGEYFLLINSDAFVHPGATAAMVNYLQAHSQVGLIGPHLLNKDGSLQRSCFRFPSPGYCWYENLGLTALFPDHPVVGDYRTFAGDTERKVDFVSGACMMLRREVYQQVDGFDERFFMYAEETDWQKRITSDGWEITFIPNAVVTHFGGASGENEKSRTDRHFLDSLNRYERKYHGLIGVILVRLAMVLGAIPRIPYWFIRYLLSGGKSEKAKRKSTLLAWVLWRQLFCWRS